ncbi:MAG: helix-turn-helix domain-containing protein, partial [Patescibacteria group bacterium]
MDKPSQSKNSDSEELYLPSAEAGKKLGYTTDHVARLCRLGELSCVRVGNRWQVGAQSLNTYLTRSRVQAEELQKQLSLVRRAEYEEKSQFVSSQEAARLSGYSQDHVARLCRDGELSCKQEGAKWRVHRDSLQSYQEQLKKTNEERNQKLSQERKQTYREITRHGARMFHHIPRSVVAGVSVALLFVFAASFHSSEPLKRVVEQTSNESQLALLWPLQLAVDPISDFIVDEFFFYTPPPLLGGSKTTPPATAPGTVVNNVTNNKITNNTFNVSGVSETQLNSQLSELEKRIIALIPKNIPYSGPSRSTPVRTETFAQAQRIDQLSGVAISGGTISGAAISGGSISGVTIPASSLSGVLALANGGTGTSTVPLQDQVLIGNGTDYDLKTLTAGSNVTISTTSSSIVISSTGGSGSSFGQAFEISNGALT